jgi:hypothetical protein
MRMLTCWDQSGVIIIIISSGVEPQVRALSELRSEHGHCAGALWVL